MRIKRYQASDMRDALRRVRADLGPEAVILGNERIAGGIEVTAAIDESAPGPSPFAGRAQAPGVGAADFNALLAGEAPRLAERNPAQPKRAAPAGQSDDGLSLAAVSEELRVLRGLLEQQLSSLAWQDMERRNPIREGVLKRLLDIGLTHSLASGIAASVTELDEPVAAWRRAVSELSARVRVVEDDILTDGGVVALLGATGVGKTTTVAKLAARFALRHGPERVALLTTDSYRIGARAQLRTFGQIIGIPVTVIEDEAALKEAIARNYDRRLVLIDTTGMSQRDRAFAEQVRLIGRGSPLVRNYLVLSATAQLRGLQEALHAFTDSRPDGCIVTKLDESASLGAVLSLLAEGGVPVAYVNTGQRVPEDIHRAHVGQLVNRALALTAHGETKLAGAADARC